MGFGEIWDWPKKIWVGLREIWDSGRCQGWNWMILEVPSNPTILGFCYSWDSVPHLGGMRGKRTRDPWTRPGSQLSNLSQASGSTQAGAPHPSGMLLVDGKGRGCHPKSHQYPKYPKLIPIPFSRRPPSPGGAPAWLPGAPRGSPCWTPSSAPASPWPS